MNSFQNSLVGLVVARVRPITLALGVLDLLAIFAFVFFANVPLILGIAGPAIVVLTILTVLSARLGISLRA